MALARELPERSRLVSAVRLPSWVGMLPVKRLDWAVRDVSAVRLPISAGKVPVMPWPVVLARLRVVTRPLLTVTPGQVLMC